MDLYEILELKPNASEIEIKKAYLRLVKVYHPDKKKTPGSEDKFRKIQSAYEILSDPKSRLEYQKMNQSQKFGFVEILEKIIGEQISLSELKKYGINLDKTDFDYLQNNFWNFFRAINVGELLGLFKKGIVPKKNFNNIINCSESDNDIFDETTAEYFYNLPISFQKNNPLDIKLELSIKLGDIASKNKRKIKIKRRINNRDETTSFVFNLTNPYVVFVGAGDYLNGDYGNLIVKLTLPNNLYWNENIILIEQNMSLYEMIYGLDLRLDVGENKNINIQNWVPSRDGFVIEITNSNNKNIESDIKFDNYNLAIKLVLDYQDTIEKEQLLRQYFS